MLIILQSIFAVLLPVLSVFLILLILVQRGRGGGLVGAFGGMGGQSAFGAKAGDLFTKITVITVSIWIAVCIGFLLSIKWESIRSSGLGEGRTSEPAAATAPMDSNTPVTIPIPSPPSP